MLSRKIKVASVSFEMPTSWFLYQFVFIQRAKIGRVFLQDSYQLMTSFPPKQLSTPTDTIEAAGLVGAVVIQKL